MSNVKYEAEFIKYLKHFENEIKHIPMNKISSSSPKVVKRTDFIFENFIDVRNVNMDKLMELLDKHKIFYRIRSFIIANVIYKLDKLKSEKASMYSDEIICKHVFRVAS